MMTFRSNPNFAMARWTMVVAVAAFGLALGASSAARAEDEATLTLKLKDHHFDPATPSVPAGQRVKVTVTNLDATPAEVESDDFKMEKVVAAGATVTLTIGPLKAGEYEIHDEYNEDVSKTKLIAK
jgi:plastocyanin